jgi:diacylglycerol kinase family enzyme
MQSVDARMAVLLNANAKQVSEDVHGAIAHVVPPEDIFLSRSVADARAIARKVVRRGYGTVFTGGGDGTFVGFLNEIFDCLAEGPSAGAPRFGLLKLGTGNALANLIGASPARGGMLDDLQRARAGEVAGIYQLDLVEAEGVRCPFVGLGLDAAIINDYAHLMKRYGGGSLGRLIEGSFGYGFAVAARTLPRYLAQRRMTEVEVVNRGGTAFRLDSFGRPIGEAIEHGEVIYRGPLKIIAAGTVPEFGFKLRFFPFAGRRRGKMHLRIFRGSPLSVLGHLPTVWRGEFFPDGTFDYFCDRVSMNFSQSMPLQVGGDAKGYREALTLGIADRTVDLLTFNRRLVN